jgi:hypothetical protein
VLGFWRRRGEGIILEEGERRELGMMYRNVRSIEPSIHPYFLPLNRKSGWNHLDLLYFI